MTSAAETFRLGLLALLGGMAIPLLVQLFLVLRNVQRVTNVLDRRLDRALGDLEDLTAGFKRATAAPPSWPGVVAAAVPALLAAGQAFRSSLTGHDDPANNHAQEKRS